MFFLKCWAHDSVWFHSLKYPTGVLTWSAHDSSRSLSRHTRHMFLFLCSTHDVHVCSWQRALSLLIFVLVRDTFATRTFTFSLWKRELVNGPHTAQQAGYYWCWYGFCHPMTNILTLTSSDNEDMSDTQAILFIQRTCSCYLANLPSATQCIKC